MAKEFNERQIMHGHGGHMWFNNKKIVTLQKVEAKITANFEEIHVCGDTATYQIFNGYGGTGSFSFLKLDSDIMKEIAAAYQSGDIQEAKLITLQKVPNSNHEERVAYLDVTFDEVTLANFEKNSITETEIPFKFGRFEILSTI